ncbi:sensor histidine kinase [Flavobacterium sp.]|uniref:sensor histidine kinase n=1 Tax=Flavobacterium sp. TaxID=239 RepID=UPI00286C6B4B|nr:sensor histidine kinase [Flavobacterium sp.]
MKKLILFFFLFSISKGFAQSRIIEKRSVAKLFELSKTLQNKALWFQEMPQYNHDSSDYYFKKSRALLKTNPSKYNEELATSYLQQNNVLQIYNSYHSMDSIALVGWSYLKKIPENKQNKFLEYNYLINWSFIKQELGEKKNALKLFSSALLLSKDFKTPELLAKVMKDKGTFYERCHLEEEQNLAYSYLSKSRSYYEKKGIENNALELFPIYKSLVGYFDFYSKDSVCHYSNQIELLLKHIQKPQNHAWYYVTSGRDLVTYPLKGDTIISPKQYDKGKNNIIKALVILEKYKINHNNVKPYAYGILADLYLNEKKYDLAISNYKKSKEGYLFMKNRKGVIDMTSFIAKAYNQKGDLVNALAQYKYYFEEALIYTKEQNERGLRENELQIDLLKQDKKLIEKQNLQTIFIIAILIGLLLLAWSYWNYNLKQKSNIKLAELNNDLESKNILLDSKNAENELLLREIHHRVKNNLEIVSSLLALQSSQIDDPNTKDAMTESQNRVNSIGIVHQKLYQGTNLGAVEMKDYFLNLTESILDSFGVEQRVVLKLAMENLDLDIDTAVPLGLIVNELLTNSVKYAFPDDAKGIITIKLHKHENILHLEVSDNGVGKSGVTYGTGFGGQLVSLLTQQLNGTMTEESQNGTTIIFDFKMKAA